MNLGDFYKHDRRLGPTVTFNGVDIYAKYNADVHSFTPSAGTIDQTYARKVSKSTFNSYYFDFAEGTLEVGCYVGGANKLDAFMNANGLIAAAKDVVIYNSDDIGFYFDAVLTGYSVEDTGIEWFNNVVLTFAAIRHMPIVTETFSGTSFEFENLGSIASGVKLTIVPTTSTTKQSFTLNAGTDDANKITFTQLTQSYSFVLDGIDGHVTRNGINAIQYTDMIIFPKVIPGMNTITATFNASWTIEYYPTFEI